MRRRNSPSDLALRGQRISHKWQIVLAFLLGGAVSSLAQDPSDYVFFWAQTHGYTDTFWQVAFWYWVPFALYIILFSIGFVLARLRVVSEVFMVYLLMALFTLSGIYSLMLPQSAVPIYVASVILGTFVSFGILFGLQRQVR